MEKHVLDDFGSKSDPLSGARNSNCKRSIYCFPDQVEITWEYHVLILFNTVRRSKRVILTGFGKGLILFFNEKRSKLVMQGLNLLLR